MVILLASNGKFLLEKGYGLLGIPKSQIRIGYVTTASKASSSLEYIESHKSEMKKNGYDFKEIDVEGKTQDELRQFFADRNIIHIEGGNTFYLLQAIKKTGFDKIVKELLNQGVIYVGTSAGSSIAGPSIELSSHLPDGVKREDLESLGLVPFLIKAHYVDAKKEAYVKKLQHIKYPVKFLRDGQAILIHNNSYEIVGDGPEVEL